jgi:hypothetical protein
LHFATYLRRLAIKTLNNLSTQTQQTFFYFSHDYQQPSTWPKSTPPSPVITPTPVLPTMIAHKLPNDSFYHTSPPLFLFEVTIKGRKNWEKNRTIKTNLKNNKMNYLCIFPCFAGDDGSQRWHRKKEEWKLIQIPIFFISLVATREPMSQQWWQRVRSTRRHCSYTSKRLQT